jgi:hypothetical protein
MGVAAARLVGEELKDRAQRNLTPEERRELSQLASHARYEIGDFALWARDELRELAKEPENRRLRQLVTKALADRPG